MSIVGRSLPFFTASSIADRRKVFLATVGSLLGSPFCSSFTGSESDSSDSSTVSTVTGRTSSLIFSPLVAGLGASVGASALAQLVDERTAALVLQTPNFLGTVEDITSVAKIVHDNGALLIVDSGVSQTCH